MKGIYAMLLYCHFIIWNDTDKASTLLRLKELIKDDEMAEATAKKFENKIMNYLAQNTTIRGRKNMAVITTMILDPANSINYEKLID
jgi:hypothetical protein